MGSPNPNRQVLTSNPEDEEAKRNAQAPAAQQPSSILPQPAAPQVSLAEANGPSGGNNAENAYEHNEGHYNYSDWYDKNKTWAQKAAKKAAGGVWATGIGLHQVVKPGEATPVGKQATDLNNFMNFAQNKGMKGDGSETEGGSAGGFAGLFAGSSQPGRVAQSAQKPAERPTGPKGSQLDADPGNAGPEVDAPSSPVAQDQQKELFQKGATFAQLFAGKPNPSLTQIQQGADQQHGHSQLDDDSGGGGTETDTGNYTDPDTGITYDANGNVVSDPRQPGPGGVQYTDPKTGVGYKVDDGGNYVPVSPQPAPEASPPAAAPPPAASQPSDILPGLQKDASNLDAAIGDLQSQDDAAYKAAQEAYRKSMAQRQKGQDMVDLYNSGDKGQQLYDKTVSPDVGLYDTAAINTAGGTDAFAELTKRFADKRDQGYTGAQKQWQDAAAEGKRRQGQIDQLKKNRADVQGKIDAENKRRGDEKAAAEKKANEEGSGPHDWGKQLSDAEEKAKKYIKDLDAANGGTMVGSAKFRGNFHRGADAGLSTADFIGIPGTINSMIQEGNWQGSKFAGGEWNNDDSPLRGYLNSHGVTDRDKQGEIFHQFYNETVNNQADGNEDLYNFFFMLSHGLKDHMGNEYMAASSPEAWDILSKMFDAWFQGTPYANGGSQ